MKIFLCLPFLFYMALTVKIIVQKPQKSNYAHSSQKINANHQTDHNPIMSQSIQQTHLFSKDHINSIKRMSQNKLSQQNFFSTQIRSKASSESKSSNIKQHRLLIDQNQKFINNTLLLSENVITNQTNYNTTQSIINDQSTIGNQNNDSAQIAQNITKPKYSIIQSQNCSLTNCRKCFQYQQMYSEFKLESFIAQENLNPEDYFKYELCQQCAPGHYLYRHKKITQILSSIQFSNGTLTQLTKLMNTVIQPQQYCVPMTQKIYQSSVMIAQADIDTYYEFPEVFKGWVLGIMRKYKVTKQELKIVFVKRGSLIIDFWFKVPAQFTVSGDVTDDVYDPNGMKDIPGSTVISFDMTEVPIINNTVTITNNTSVDNNSTTSDNSSTVIDLDSSGNSSVVNDTGSISNSTQDSSKSNNQTELINSNPNQNITVPQIENNTIQEDGDKSIPEDNKNSTQQSKDNSYNSNTHENNTINDTEENITTIDDKNNSILNKDNSTELLTSPSSNSQTNLLPIIIAGAISLFILIVAAIYMLICRKQNQQEQPNDKNLQTQIQPNQIIRPQNTNKQNTIQKQQTSILKDNPPSITQQIKHQQPTKQLKKQTLLKQKTFWLFGKWPKSVIKSKQQYPKSIIGADQIQSMEQLAKSNNQSSKPIKNREGFI